MRGEETMNCKKCQQAITIKDSITFITLKCRCEIIIIRPDKTISQISKEEYDKRKRGE